MLDWILSILRDNALEGIGTILAILVVIAPWISRKLKLNFFGTRFRKAFWWFSVPVLSASTILAAVWLRLELVIVFSTAIIVLHLVRQREFLVERAELKQQCKKLAEAAHREVSTKGTSPHAIIKDRKSR